MPKRQSPDWPSWFRAMMLGEARRAALGVDHRTRQATVDLGVGLGDVEQAKHLLAFEPGHLESPLDEVLIAILAEQRHGCFAGLRRRRRSPATVRDSSGDNLSGLRIATMGSRTEPSVLDRSAPASVEGRRIRGRPPAADEPRAVGLVRDFLVAPARRRQHVEHPRRLLVGRAGTPPAQDGPVVGQYLGLHEQVAEGAMREIGVLRRQDDLGVARHLDVSRVVGQVGERDAADLDVVLGRHADLGVRFDVVIEPAVFRARLDEDGLVAIGLLPGRLIGGTTSTGPCRDRAGR